MSSEVNRLRNSLRPIFDFALVSLEIGFKPSSARFMAMKSSTGSGLLLPKMLLTLDLPVDLSKTEGTDNLADPFTP